MGAAECSFCLKRDEDALGERPRYAQAKKQSRVTAYDGLEQFRLRSKAACRDKDKLVDAACLIVEALAKGPSSQHGELQVDAEVSAASKDGTVALTLHLGQQALLAEIATRSRIAHNLRLEPTLQFSLRQSSQDETRLTLNVGGLSFPALPEIANIRKKLQHAGKLDKESAYSWWCEHKHAEYPLKTTKFHRVWESLWGRTCMQVAPDGLRKEAFWGLVNASNVKVEAFEFSIDQHSAVRTGAQVRYSADESDSVQHMIAGGVKALHEQRESGEKVAASAINWAALLFGAEAARPAASAASLVTLMSAAQWWGPSDSGWQQWDVSWNCTDKKNMLGQVVAKQGRLIWSIGEEHNAASVRVLGKENACSGDQLNAKKSWRPEASGGQPSRTDAIETVCCAQCFPFIKLLRS